MNPEHAWFTHDRFGMFVHWGLYALPARHEWVMNRERIHTEDYEKYFDYFEADLYDPREWAQAAKNAGMKYVVLTTKHHEGFAMWDTALTDYKVTKTPHGKDVVAAYVEALREADLKVGFYHSLIDWHHPDYLVDPVHPRRDDENAAALNEGRDMNKYRDYLHGQVRELLSNYGTIDYIFFDFSFPGRAANGLEGKGKDDWNSPELIKLVRQLQPNIIVNDRLDIPGDLVTPEQYQPSGPMTRDGQPVIWEACQTLNGSWGYDRDNHDYKVRFSEADPSQTAQNTTPGGQPAGTVTLDLPIQPPDVAVPVVEIFLEQ
jgi:alpha-L-fucosidase